eukprot:331272_1
MFEILQYCYKYGSWNTSLVTTSTNQEPLFLHQTTSDFVNQINYTQIKSWLESIGMVQYYESFITNNYESKEDIIKIKTKQQLQNIGISLKGHQTKMLADIRRLQKQCTKKNNQKRFHKINKRPKDDISDDEIQIQKYAIQVHKIVSRQINCISNDISACGHVKRLLTTIKKYEDWNQNQNDYGELKWEAIAQILMNKSCDITCLMDDINHYRDKHNDKYNILYITQNIDVSLICNRKHDIENHHAAKYNNNTMSFEEILKLQILDNIHLQFMHNETPVNNVPKYQQDEKNDDFEDGNIPIKATPFLNSGPITHLMQNKMYKKHQKQCDKYISHKPQKAMEFSDMRLKSMDYDLYDSDDSDVDDIYIPAYCFGKRWYYWSYYKTVKPNAFIQRKYANFKQELLNNKIYNISNIDWNNTHKKALTYMKCANALSLKASSVYCIFIMEKYQMIFQFNYIILLLYYSIQIMIIYNVRFQKHFE